MKPHNKDLYWILDDCVPTITIEAENIKSALIEYAKEVGKEYIEISKSALKKKRNMYIDTSASAKQVGYVITGKTGFENHGKWISQYIDLWVRISEVKDLF